MFQGIVYLEKVVRNPPFEFNLNSLKPNSDYQLAKMNNSKSFALLTNTILRQKYSMVYFRCIFINCV